MPRPDVVVIGASAGGLPALTRLIEDLPADLQVCILVVMHTPADGSGVLPEILARKGALPVGFAKNFDEVTPGRIYVARPDFHLIVTERGLRVLHGPRENGFRPAIDPLFRTAARTYGTRVVGVILSGALDDGTYGLSVIKQLGGMAIVQEPSDAIIPSMPQSAIAHVDVDHIVRAAEMADLIVRLSREAITPGEIEMARSKELEPQLPSEPTEVASMGQMYGAPSPLTCPECGGSLWEIQDARVVRYQCHTGHQYAPDSLQSEQRDAVDSALWSAVRVLEEHAELKMRMARRAADGGLSSVSAGFESGARDAHAQAQQIRTVLFSAGNGGGNGSGTIQMAESIVPGAATKPSRARGGNGRESSKKSPRANRKKRRG